MPNNISNTIILIFSLQGILLSGLLFARSGHWNIANRYLSILLILYALIALNIPLQQFLDIPSLRPAGFHLEMLLGIGPATYFYIKSVTDPNYKYNKTQLYHFIPLGLEFIYYRTGYFVDSHYYIKQNIFHHSVVVFFIVKLMGLMSILIYTGWSLKVLLRFRKWVREQSSNLDRDGLFWLLMPIITFSLVWILWFILRLVDWFIFSNQLIFYYFINFFIILSGLACWLGFQGYIRKPIKIIGFSDVKPYSVVGSPQKSDKEFDDLRRLLEKSTRLIEEQNLYLNSNLSLKELARYVDTSVHDLSRAINTVSGKNFNEYINRFRVEEFKSKMLQDTSKQYTILALALESGFSSKSSFNSVFRKSTGKSPTAWLKEVQNP